MPKVVITGKKGLVQSAGTGIELNGSTNLTGVSTIDAPSAAEAASTSTVSKNTNLQLVTQANNANDRIYLPSPTDVPLGHVIVVVDKEGTGFELSSKGDGTTATTINGTAVTDGAGAYAKELAFAADQMAVAMKIGTNAWSVGLATVVTPD